MPPITTSCLQTCPVCSRPLQVKVQFLGQTVVCQHCRGTFLARDPATSKCEPDDRRRSLLQRVDAILEMLQHAPRIG